MSKQTRKKSALISEGLQAKYKKACDLYETYLGCLRDGPCPTGRKSHCATCTAYLDLSLEVHTALGLKPWHVLDFDFENVQDALEAALEEHPR